MATTNKTPLHEAYEEVVDALLVGIYSDHQRQILLICYYLLKRLLEQQGETFEFGI
jgi:hypothetical protein